jgi:hypothetical protein
MGEMQFPIGIEYVAQLVGLYLINIDPHRSFYIRKKNEFIFNFKKSVVHSTCPTRGISFVRLPG